MFVKKARFIVLLTLIYSLCAQGAVSIIEWGNALLVKTEYGDYLVHEPVLMELLKCTAMDRLNHIHQYGVCRFAREEKQFTRFEHSVGVFVLLRRFGASIEEQIDGLMHDVSHTVFSHVGDVVFKSYFNRYSYQDDIHEWFLEKMGVADLLKKHGYAEACSSTTKTRHRMFEQDKPDLCMDRIEYLLRGGLVDNLITQKEIMPIVDDLYFENQLWIFKHADKAKQLATISLWLTENVFGAAWNSFIYSHAANALLHALKIKLISTDDIHFSTDDVVWNKLRNEGDDFIKQSLNKICECKSCFAISDESSYDEHYKEKFLGVDPWVETPRGLQRLTSIDKAYAKEYNRVLQLTQRGWYVTFKK